MNNVQGLICLAVSWGVATLAGIVIMALLMVVGDWTLLQALYVGVIAIVVFGIVLAVTMCRPLPAPRQPGDLKAAPAPRPAQPAAAPAATVAAAPAPAPAPAPEAPAAETGKRPEGMSAAREGGPDDLKQIKGVGPKLEELLHSMGFYHFDQIAAWTDEEVAWVDDNLEGFKGRVSRDNWIEQARDLAKSN
ncbi:NADH-ubiquinone oxidoreductase chain E [Roseibacterium elongatum DSM 19469]|uniref:NADH-ubiquinone oxidoreductase chain E n=1 Tax=Roseicyclus elongatus DSM 19469 TaxID=1294273 RepID=W8S1N9_9RHOB|nr:NADH-ubiquinone oxidoreductase chain E [Roseibacterium elongatum DSM 19469]